MYITAQKLELIKTVLEYHFTDEQWSEFFSKAEALLKEQPKTK
jgi:hypothetical protein